MPHHDIFSFSNFSIRLTYSSISFAYIQHSELNLSNRFPQFISQHSYILQMREIFLTAYLHENQNIQRVIVFTEGSRNEAVVVGIHHRRVKNAVNLKHIMAENKKSFLLNEKEDIICEVKRVFSHLEAFKVYLYQPSSFVELILHLTSFPNLHNLHKL